MSLQTSSLNYSAVNVSALSPKDLNDGTRSIHGID